MSERLKALTIWQPWASLIMLGAKPFEFRRWAAPDAVVGQRIVIHAGARPVKAGEVILLSEALLFEDGAGTGLRVEIATDPIVRLRHGIEGRGPAVDLPLGCGLGTALLGRPRRVTEIYGDSDRVDHHVWAWPLTDIRPFKPPVPARGAQGLWRWPYPVERA